jgi:hypothetical protein
MTPRAFPKNKSLSFLWVLLLSACLMALGSCVRAPLNMDVYLSDNLNEDNPLPVDVIAVCDPKMLSELLTLDANGWFKYKRHYMWRYQDGEDYQIWSWEWVPGNRVLRIDREIPCEPKAILVYAGYRGDGAYRAYIRDVLQFRLEFHENDFGVFRAD